MLEGVRGRVVVEVDELWNPRDWVIFERIRECLDDPDERVDATPRLVEAAGEQRLRRQHAQRGAGNARGSGSRSSALASPAGHALSL